MMPSTILRAPIARIALVLFLIVQAAAPLRAQIAPSCASLVASEFVAPAALARDSFVALVGREPVAGATIAVVVRGELAWSEALGAAHVGSAEEGEAGTRRPACRDTRFRLGSVSKVVTALALLRLQDAGRLDLDDDVRGLVDAVAHQPAAITLRQLAGHLGGIRHYRSGDEYMNSRRYERVGDALGIFSADSLVAPPGENYQYSSYGFNLLGAALEPAAGSDYAAAVADRVLNPLGLASTSPEAASPAGALATRYSLRDDSLRVSPAFDPSDRLPSGGWVASAEDAARLGFALVDRGFLSESARALLLESQRTSAGEPTGTSIGVRTGVDAAGRRILHHGGTSVGARAFLLVYPDHGVAVALLANGPAEFAEAEVGRVAEVFLAD
jgi:CubicO group peptidase (beta-lactamase class C family)